MKQAMITVCGDFGDKYWVSDIMLTSVTKLANALGQNDCEVVYADSMDNAQMIDPVRGIGMEANLARKNDADILFIIYKDEGSLNNLYAVFSHLRDVLSRHIVLVLVDIGNKEALRDELKILLNQRKGVTFWRTGLGYDKLTMRTLLGDVAFEASLLR